MFLYCSNMVEQRLKSQVDLIDLLSLVVAETDPVKKLDLLHNLEAGGARQQIAETLGEQYVALLLSEVDP